jgi:hypothetical protein
MVSTIAHLAEFKDDAQWRLKESEDYIKYG